MVFQAVSILKHTFIGKYSYKYNDIPQTGHMPMIRFKLKVIKKKHKITLDNI